MHKKPKTKLLLAFIFAKAAEAEGFRTIDARVMHSEKNSAKLCREEHEAGTLIRVRASLRTQYVYFTTPALANAFQAAQVLPVKARQPAPRPSAEIIHTAETRYSVQPFVDLRAVSVPYLKIGQPGWSMSVGGSA